mmetsp:Transcript_9880/g.22494  ORF Transcript_9880/g.22494 Transcript_9880/m.22494 type:complete len:536 (-) Transcript_9880:230-1837(-)
MVKFGRHLQFYLEEEPSYSSGKTPFIVPYSDIRGLIGESQATFTQAWQNSRKAASDDYLHRTRVLWEKVFGDLVRHGCVNYRGLPFDEAIQTYANSVGERSTRDLFSVMKKIHMSSSMNVEALRKLVKKFDKGAESRGDDMLTPTLLPELYSSPIMACSTLEVHIETLRDRLTVEDNDESIAEDDTSSVMLEIQKKVPSQDSVAVKRRAEEMQWLKNMVKTIPATVISSLVAHRGFHCPRDNSGKRPLENSLSAFESAWASGLHLCECDVALTKDEQIVLAHDEDFARLALDPNSQSSNKKVSDLTMREIISLTFKSGSRPPLLVDVLRSADAIGESSQLVIEIKPGNQEVAEALIRLFRIYPELIERVAVVMSFDLYTMHRMKALLDGLAAEFKRAGAPKLPRPDSPDRAQDFHSGSKVPLGDVKMPQVLLLTVAKEPQAHFELWVDVADFTPIDSWLVHESHELDGVYLQFRPHMLSLEGMANIRSLCSRTKVGIWGEFGDGLDDLRVETLLVKECGVRYVNTDLPRNFSKYV